MSITKILFINPPYSIYGGVKGHGGKNAPLNLGYLASYVRTRNEKVLVDIIDAEGLELSLTELYKRVDTFSPDIIGITCPTPVYYIIKNICTELKKRDPDVIIILGGPHPTALPRETLMDMDVDMVVIGEGEETFIELVRVLQNGEKLDKVMGLAFKDNGNVVINSGRELIKDLDILPFPAKDLLPLERYYLPPTKRIRSERATNMVTSRGCPFACTFCMARVIWGKQTRLRSIGNVLDEVEENVKVYGLTEFSFHDELFTLKKSRVIEFCKGLINRGLDISWVCMARAGTVDAEMLEFMKKGGCGKISFGFESGNQCMLNLMNKKETLEEAVKSVHLCKEAGIKVVGTFILGHPGETIDSIQDTIRFAIKLDVETAAFFIAIPYPGTELYALALKNGYLSKESDWKKFAPVSKLESPMVLPNISPEELQDWKCKAYKKFYLRPRYIVRKLKCLCNYGEMKSLFRGIRIFLDIT
ncbi:MAG: B12-binding domain-containing radical SAM protein [Planctomycetota bacterium]|jgi:radical SAM superfamily enzyme YgiQ (UPF0313 family)